MSAEARRALRRASLVVAGLLLCWVAGCAARREPTPEHVPTPAERNGFARPSTAAEVAAFVDVLAALSPDAEALTIGTSAGGRPIRALVVDRAPARSGDGSPAPLTVLVVGSQHGTEPSGTEAILAFARDLLLDRSAADALPATRFVLVPDGNPDGRDARRRVNANGVNLSTNYVTLSEPETRAVAGALRRWQPELVIDLHESALLKKSSLGAQGYLTDFEAQVETSNNPNVDPALQGLLATLLPEAIAAVRRGGVPADRYLGEITDVAQPITHGGPSVKNLRNAAGMAGAATLLVENRLDPPGDGYATPRNLRARTAKQLVALRAIVGVAVARRADVAHATRAARDAWRSDQRPVTLAARWAEEPREPRIVVPLRRRDDGEVELRDFARHTRLVTEEPVSVPFAYVVTEHQDAIATVLDRHAIAYERLAAPLDVRATVQRVRAMRPVPARHGWGYVEYDVAPRAERVRLPAGTLWVPLVQPPRRLVPLLLEPRAPAGLFQDAAYAPLVRSGRDFFVLRVEGPADAPSRPASVSRAPSRGSSAPRG